MNQLDRSNLRQISAEMNQALNLVLKKHGLSVEVGSARFSPTDATFKVKVSIGNAEDAGRRDWDRYSFYHGLSKDLFGKSFTYNGSRYTISGYAPKSRRYPVLAKRDFDGQVMKFTAELAKTAK